MTDGLSLVSLVYNLKHSPVNNTKKNELLKMSCWQVTSYYYYFLIFYENTFVVFLT